MFDFLFRKVQQLETLIYQYGQGCQISIIDFNSVIFFRTDLSFSAFDFNTPTRRLTAEPLSPKISPICELVRTPSCHTA